MPSCAPSSLLQATYREKRNSQVKESRLEYPDRRLNSLNKPLLFASNICPDAGDIRQTVNRQGAVYLFESFRNFLRAVARVQKPLKVAPHRLP